VQVRKQDSLRRLIRAASRPDTALVNHLNTLSSILRTNNVPEARQLLYRALRLSQRLQYPQGIANAQFGLGYYYRGNNAYDSAFYRTQQAIQLYSILGDSYNRARGLYNLARIYYEQGKYGLALQVNYEGLLLTQAKHNRKGEVFQLVQLGVTNTALGEYITAQKHLRQALYLAQSLHEIIGLGHTYNALGDLNRAQSRWTLAGYYYAKAAASYHQVYNAIGMLPTELNLVEMMERQGNHTQALAITTSLLQRTHVVRSPGQIARAQLLLARVYFSLAQYDSARYYAATSLAINSRRGRKQEAHDATEVLALANAELGQWDKAYRYQRLTTAYKDSLSSDAIRHQAIALQLAYDRSQQQIQIRLLRQQARLHDQQQELERLRYRQQLTGLAVLVLLVVLLSGVLLWHYRRREARRVEALRTRIAADLHDEVGSMLTQIAMQSTLLREGRYAPAQQQAYLDQMAEASRRAARQMSDAVWSIDARYDSASSLLDRLRDHAHEVLPPAGLELDFVADEILAAATVPLATRQALYFIYKEALHNVVKHAKAQQVRVRLHLPGRELVLEIRDNGQGLRQASRPSGQGLPNMRMRAKAVGGTLTFDTTGVGMGIVARLPLR
jgi:signal transduction histidine kinase